MKKFLLLCLLSAASLCLPVALHGQGTVGAFRSSISGQVFSRVESDYPPFSAASGTWDMPISHADIVLIAGADTLRTKTDDFGTFSFSGISSRRVTLYAEARNDRGEALFYPYFGTFELSPGENLVLIPRETLNPPFIPGTISATDAAIVTKEDDIWVYHLPDQSFRGINVAGNKLKDLPGIEYKRRKGLLYISGKSVNRAYVNGAFIFGLKPGASPVRK